jgi:Sec-independent protein translocase protein TatA
VSATPKANTAGDWIKKWGLWILLAIVVILVVCAKLFPSNGSKPKILQAAKDGAKKLKDAAEAKLEEHTSEMKAREEELEEIKAITDEEERLKRLAEFANRRST